VNVKNMEDLYYWASRGRTNDLEKHLNQHPDHVNQRDDGLFTPLHGAVEGDSIDAAKLLISKGADIDAQNDMAVAPIHMAASVEMIQLLSQAGANINIQMENGDTALHTLLGDDREDDCILCLLQNGADKTIRNHEQVSPLDIAKKRGRSQLILALSL
jgi:ankyrin repeat protein